MVGCAGERLNGSLWINKAAAVAGNNGGNTATNSSSVLQRTEGGEGDQRCASKVICT